MADWLQASRAAGALLRVAKAGQHMP